MTNKDRMTPKRRFREFKNAHAWEQRKLGEIASEMVAGGDIDKDLILDEGRYPVIANALTNDGIVGYYNANYRVKAPAVTVTGRGDVGHAKARIIDFTPVVRLLSITSNHDIFFLENAINTLKIVIESTGVPQLTVPQLVKYDIYFPKLLDEEKKIGVFFHQLDTLITLHQRKVDKLKDLKAGYLAEMFPAEGQRKPKRRFSGFTDDWEQRKFNEVFVFLQNNAFSRAELATEGEIMNVHYGDVLVKYGEVLDISKDEMTYLAASSVAKKYQTSLLKDGDVIIADAAEDETVGKCCEIAGLSGNTVLSGLHTIPCRPTMKFAEGYLGYYMNSGAYHDQLIPLIQGTKISSISKSAIQDTEVVYPKSEVEQERIGAYFKNLDHLITLHQRKLEKLQDIKKAYLEEMFV